ncbi:MAG: Type secretion system hydrolase TadA/VirB11/CpaF, TadA subfamily protein, partial [Labilithrix sp.]|nr:Type secretion system hydrolase TadA/VirB11/CpaF, TadA subfamily protein [Labilithrix sp.]
MNLQVVVQSDDGTQRTELYPANGPLTIGRHPQCSLRLDSDLVSRQHAVIQAGQGTLRVEDVSTNGTIAGDLLLRRDSVDVPYGTPIVVGDFTVFVYPADQPNAAQHAAMTARQMQGMPRPNGQQQQHPTAPQQPFNSGQHPTHPHAATAMNGGMNGAMGTGPNPMMNGNGMVARNGAGGNVAISGAIPAVTGMNPVIAHVGAAPAAQGVHLPMARRDDAKHKAEVELRREIHKLLLEHLDLATIDAKKLDDPSMRPKVLNALRRIVASLTDRIPKDISPDTLIGELADEALGLGPLERFLADPTISEVMVVDPNTIYIEQNGRITLSHARFTDDERVRAVIERIVTPLGRRIDESSPLVDARLKDGSRVNAVIRPIALRGSCITIRKFAKVPLTMDKIVSFGTMTERMGRFLTRCVHAKRNIVISGGTGSGKTTLLNVLSGAIPSEERIVTIEDAAELQLKQPHVVSMETRPPNLEGRGEYSIRDLVKNALRMRPDRIIVGECRGGEALDMLQAMNTGHDGSLTTTHANSPTEAISRLETLVLMAGVDLPLRAIRDQISAAVHVIVQQSRMSDGTRKVTHISEVTGIDHETSEIELRPIFEYVRTGTGPKGEVIGEYRATGYLPS